MANLTLRTIKGDALTFRELDSNFLALDSDIQNLTSTLSGSYVTLDTIQTIIERKNFTNGVVIDSATIANLSYPLIDGTDGQFLKTDGAGNLTFDTVTSYDSVKVQGQIDSDFTNTKTTTDLSEGINLYFTEARARNAISAAGDLSYDAGTGIISYTDSAPFAVQFNAESTTNLSEGTNLYYTDTRARNAVSASGDLSYDAGTGIFSYTDSAPFAVQFAAESTTNLSEGTNLYYTDARANTAIDARIDSDTFVRLTTDQTIAGIKTFQDSVVVAGLSGETFTVTAASTGDVVLGGSGTIGGTTWANGTFHLGDAVSGWAMDRNEFYNSGAAIIGTLSGTLTLNPNTVTTTSKQFQSSVSTGTAPFTVASTTLVSNLNVDRLDNQEGSYYRIDVFDASGTLLN